MQLFHQQILQKVGELKSLNTSQHLLIFVGFVGWLWLVSPMDFSGASEVVTDRWQKWTDLEVNEDFADAGIFMNR